MGRARKRADRIREMIPIVQVLGDYGYAVRLDGGDREQQFSCNLHGDGHDIKPSARVYPHSNSWHCFACSASRDAIETVREIEGVEFRDACVILEQKYGLPPLPWDDEDDAPEPEEAIRSDLSALTFEDAKRRTYRLIDGQREERALPLSNLLAFWEAFDMIAWHVESERCPEPWSEKKGIESMMKLRDRILSKLRKAVQDGPSPTADHPH